MKQYLLIDIGGTFIKYSLADEQARKISGGKVPTPLTNMDDLLAVIEGFAAPLQGQFVGCAISMPGRIDTRNGIAHTGGMLSAFMWEQPFAAQGAALMESLFGSFLTVSGSYTGAAASAAASVAGVAIIGGADGPTAIFVTTLITAQEIWGLCVKVFSNVVVVVLNYVFSKLIIFKKK